MQLANETVAMMKLFTAALSESFTMPEIVQRLADMMDYNLDTLVGPKSRDLKVQNPEKYYFNPRALLAEIIDIEVKFEVLLIHISAPCLPVIYPAFCAPHGYARTPCFPCSPKLFRPPCAKAPRP